MSETSFPNPPFSTSATLPGISPPAPPTVVSASSGTNNNFTYALVVQIPVPQLSLGALTAAFNLPTLIPVAVPQALQWLTTNATEVFQDVVNLAAKLVKAIPSASVSIQVKVGPITVINVQLVAQQTPVPVPLPSFTLGLPNMALGLGVTVPLPLPVPPPIVIAVPIPVPVVTSPLQVGVTGGQISGSVSGTVAPHPVPVSDPVRLPVI